MNDPATYDAIVFGGGTAGTIAAIQAGRAGARVLLIEKNAMLGGTMTVGGINFPACFFAWGRQIVGGIGWELVRKTLEETGQKLPSAEPTRDNSRPVSVAVDKPIFAALCDEAALEAGVEILFHAMPAAIELDGGLWTVRVCSKSGLRKIAAKTLIDATGDANAVALAGFDVERADLPQPATLQMRCCGYDAQKLDYPALKAAAELAIAAGELKTTDISWNDKGPESFLRSHGNNANHIVSAGAETSEGRTAIEIEARRSALRMHRFFRRQPGLENFRVDWICPEAGVRESAIVKGKETITVRDYEAGRLYEDAVCYAFYPVDEHLNAGRGINYRLLRPNVLPTIPRGAMLPAGSGFFIIAGRCVSSDREANSALRVECPCMAMGQAAGAMAALSARAGTDPEKLPIGDIRGLLREHGAIVPPAAGT